MFYLKATGCSGDILRCYEKLILDYSNTLRSNWGSNQKKKDSEIPNLEWAKISKAKVSKAKILEVKILNGPKSRMNRNIESQDSDCQNLEKPKPTSQDSEI